MTSHPPSPSSSPFPGETPARLMDYLRLCGAPVTLSQMALALDEDQQDVSRALAILYGAGEVVLAADGFRYQAQAVTHD